MNIQNIGALSRHVLERQLVAVVSDVERAHLANLLSYADRDQMVRKFHETSQPLTMKVLACLKQVDPHIERIILDKGGESYLKIAKQLEGPENVLRLRELETMLTKLAGNYAMTYETGLNDHCATIATKAIVHFLKCSVTARTSIEGELSHQDKERLNKSLKRIIQGLCALRGCHDASKINKAVRSIYTSTEEFCGTLLNSYHPSFDIDNRDQEQTQLFIPKLRIISTQRLLLRDFARLFMPVGTDLGWLFVRDMVKYGNMTGPGVADQLARYEHSDLPAIDRVVRTISSAQRTNSQANSQHAADPGWHIDDIEFAELYESVVADLDRIGRAHTQASRR